MDRHTAARCPLCEVLEKSYGCHVRKPGVVEWDRREYPTEAALDLAIVAWESMGYEVA